MKVEPASSVVGDLAVPGAKSICHRGVLLGAVADGTTEIRGFGHAADTDSTIAAVRQLGVRVEEPEAETVLVEGAGLRGLREPGGPIDCGNAGTLMRLLAGLLAGQEGRFELVGDASLSSRPHERIAEPLRAMGAHVETTDGGAPIVIEERPLHCIEYALPAASAQVKSAILLAGLYAADGPTVVREPAPTRDHTERLLEAMGARMRYKPGEAAVWPAERIEAVSLDVPGDFSSAAPFLVLASLLSGSDLRIHGVNLNPTRTGFLAVLERMGAHISVFHRRMLAGEPAGDLEVRPAALVATTIGSDEVPLLVDELPLFALAASMARGTSMVYGAGELRVKESDRIETVVSGLRSIGARIEATKDGFRVRGVPTRLRGGSMSSHGDHRIAMLGAVAGLLSREGVELEGAEAVAISFPGFFDLVERVAHR